MLLKISPLIIIALFCAAAAVSEDLPPEQEQQQSDDTDSPALESFLNVTYKLDNATETSNATEAPPPPQKWVQCVSDFGNGQVQIVNDTELIKILLPQTNVTGRDVPAGCVVVLFYSKYCPFSSMAAPHFNALPRAFPDLKMAAINAMIYHLFNTQNGIIGVPSIVLFHNGRVAARFNDSEYTLDLFSKFITKHTGIAPVEKSTVTSADFSGPVTSVPAKDMDIFLIISWLFIGICAVYYFTKSKICKWIVETVQRNWRESEAQHEHIE